MERLLSADRGFIFHLEPDHLVARLPEPPFRLRPLAGSDQTALLELCSRCQTGEVEDATIEVGHEIACGCFEAGRMVAAASGYRRNGFMDLGVLTNPAYRGRRLAPAMVAELSRKSVAKGLIPMYRCDRTNVASRRVAEVSGFTQYFETESLTLAPE
jgi:predicted GNAT family acetyltransferase